MILALSFYITATSIFKKISKIWLYSITLSFQIGYLPNRASDRVRKKFGHYAALLRLIMRQERSIMRQIMRFHFS